MRDITETLVNIQAANIAMARARALAANGENEGIRKAYAALVKMYEGILDDSIDSQQLTEVMEGDYSGSFKSDSIDSSIDSYYDGDGRIIGFTNEE